MVNKIEQLQPLSPVSLGDELVAHHRGFVELRNLTGPVPVEQARFLGLGAPVPTEMLLGCLRDGRLRVLAPIVVKFSTEDEHVIAEAEKFNEFGFGKNPSEALIDLQRAIAELYFTLEKEQGRLGPDLQSVWAHLGEKIQKR